MSKVDAQRAMREAKYARLRASGPTRREEAVAEEKPARAAPAPARDSSAAVVPDAAPANPARAGQLCGHRSMNGRECTREPGHPEKSHRYS